MIAAAGGWVASGRAAVVLIASLGALMLPLRADAEATPAAPPTPPAPPMHHHHEAPAPASAPAGQGGMAMEMDMAMPGMAMAMRGQLGPYSMSREASGTSWQPEATPMEMLHTTRGDWSLMLHGYAMLVGDRQTGARGDRKTFSESMLMGMATRPLGAGTLGLRAMVSLDPTMGSGGYPLLAQTGESADGKTPLIDRQHPHDALMELSGSYSAPVAPTVDAFLYAGLPGEPALGPPTFMHRASGMRNPEAPITHHWFDSTHITFGVVTAGAIAGPWKLEGSWFNGREPDERRWNIETRGFDSWSGRLSWNPTPAWSLQTSYGSLKSPEALEPTTSVRRLTASAIYQTKLADHDWATTLAWSRNDKHGPEGRSLLPAVLLESTFAVSDRGAVFGRYEHVDKDELFGPTDPRHGTAYRVQKLSLGYVRDLWSTGVARWSVGGDVGVLPMPSALASTYGRRPMSYLLFLQARIAP